MFSLGFAYGKISILIALGIVGASIFYFLEDDVDRGRLLLLFATMAFFGSYYTLKALYYLRHQATFNEVSFVIVLPLVPLIQLLVKEFLEIEIDSLIFIDFTLEDQSIELIIDELDLLFTPYYLFSIFLLLRANLRYPFIRFRGHSERGFPSRLIALILISGIPILYLFVGYYIFQNGMLIIFAFIYLIVGIMGLFV